MDFTEDVSHVSSNTVRKRSSARKAPDIRDIIEHKRQDIQEAGAHLWHRHSDPQQLKYDVILIIAPKGYHIIDSLIQLIGDKLPELTVDLKPHSHYKEQAFYITGPNDQLLSGAKQLGYRVRDDHPLTTLERQTIIIHFLNTLRYDCDDTGGAGSGSSPVAGFSDWKRLRLRHRDPIIPKLVASNLIKQVLPLHNDQDLLQLRRQWVAAFFSPQPLDTICHYFGYKIAIYFAFLGYYTYALIFPAILGTFITVYATDNSPYGECLILSFTLLNIVWSTVFLQKWRNTSNKLIRHWNSTDNKFETDCSDTLVDDYDDDKDQLLVRRPLYRDRPVTDTLTVEAERKLFKYLVSYPVIAVCLAFIFGLMIAVFRLQTYWDDVLIAQSALPVWTKYIPKILLAILVSMFEPIYYSLAVWLNNKENYELETTHENNLILKLILLQFMNSYLSLFYIAFYIGDMDALKEQLATLLIIRQLIGNIKESLVPFVWESYKLSQKLHKIRVQEISSVELEADMRRYDSTFDDYLEMIIQFGYVMLFSSTFPLAALCAIINNVIEIRSDAFKLCVLYQRPPGGHRVKDIGQWEQVINAIAYVAIIVNCALIAKTRLLSVIVGVTDDVQLVLISVVIEHLLLALKWLSPFIF